MTLPHGASSAPDGRPVATSPADRQPAPGDPARDDAARDDGALDGGLDDLGPDDGAPDDVGLPTFVVLARFAEAADSAEQAERSVRERLTATRDLFDDVAVERREDDGTWLLEVRFVVVSVDAQTAVTGVYETLAAARLSPDEVWVPLEPEPEPEPT